MSDPQKVFLIHGRNAEARSAMILFLRTLKLEVVDFDDVSARCGGAAFLGAIIRKGMDEARGIVALFTADEFAKLAPELGSAHDKPEDKERWQARPNVIFEAGMAMGIDENRTILVTLGADIRLFSDMDGRHIVRLNNTPDKRKTLVKRLKGIGCLIDSDADWHDTKLAGDFESCLPKRPAERGEVHDPHGAFAPPPLSRESERSDQMTSEDWFAMFGAAAKKM